MIEELPVEPEPEAPQVTLEPEPEPEPPKTAPKAAPKPEPKPEPKRPGRPKKDPSAPKAKYTPRKPKPAQEPVREPVREPVQPVRIDEARLAQSVVRNIAQASRDHFEARRDGWRDLVASNYML